MSSAVIPKAHVEILDVSTTLTKKLEADADGKLSIDVPLGTYEVTASSTAFRTEKKKIEVTTANQTISFMLNVGGGSTVDVVPVTSGSEPTYVSLPDALENESNIPPLNRNIDAYSFCLPCPAQAQKQTAHLTIQVKDMSGAVIPKAHVEILGVSTTFTKKLEANDEGTLAIELPFGVYEVTASYPAFKTERKKIEVNTANQTVSFMLNVASGGGVQVVGTSLEQIVNLEQTVASLDKTLFDAYNTCDLATFKNLLADDIEFYHDKGGVTLGKDKLTEAIKNNICGKVTRELVGKPEVYPMQGIGAVEIGVHRFHHPGQTPDVVGEAKFVQLWVYKDGAWKVSRVFSFDHHEIK